MATIYTDKDATLDLVRARKVAVIGYGSQGHAHALNLKDSGVDVRVGLHAASQSRQKAQAAGVRVLSVAEAAREADLIMVLTPDEKQRRIYEGGQGTPALIAVQQDASGQAHALGLSYARALGATRAAVLETTFREETETDLFGEQTVLCGGITSLVVAGYDTLVEAGYQPESAYFECLHELKLIVDMMYEGGLGWMRHSISDTAEYGDYTRGPRVVTEETRAQMKKILREIQTGQFAREWILENQAGRPAFDKLREEGKAHPIEEVGRRMRELMSWLRDARKDSSEAPRKPRPAAQA